MQNVVSSAPKATTPGMRQMLLAASILVAMVGVPLFLFTSLTDTYFAWTIASPLTAAFLGGAYWASFVLEFMAFRETTWARARVAVPAVLAFTALTLIVTLLHADKFHFNSTNPVTVAGTWVWLAVYALVPPIMAVLLVRQLRTPGGEAPRVQPLAAWMRGVFAFNALVMILGGLLLLFVPLLVAPAWPWALTALTGRAIGAWLIGLGISAGHAAWENDLTRLRPMLAGTVAFASLELVALARYGGEFDPTKPVSWLFLLCIGLLLVVGVYGLLAGRSSAMRQPQAA